MQNLILRELHPKFLVKELEDVLLFFPRVDHVCHEYTMHDFHLVQVLRLYRTAALHSFGYKLQSSLRLN